jgi:hypothetical protein
MKIFISGGCKSGKSYHVQRLAKSLGPDQQAAQRTARRAGSLYAKIDRVAATHCDVVLEIVYTNVKIHKGKKQYEKII